MVVFKNAPDKLYTTACFKCTFNNRSKIHLLQLSSYMVALF